MVYAAHLTAIERHVAASTWPEALRAALDAWRATRLPELADLVDAIGTRCVPTGEPPTDNEWRERAMVYEPAVAGWLLAHLHGHLVPGVARPMNWLAWSMLAPA